MSITVVTESPTPPKEMKDDNDNDINTVILVTVFAVIAVIIILSTSAIIGYVIKKQKRNKFSPKL